MALSLSFEVPDNGSLTSLFRQSFDPEPTLNTTLLIALSKGPVYDHLSTKQDSSEGLIWLAVSALVVSSDSEPLNRPAS